LLIEGDARNLGRQFQEIQQFVQGLGPNTRSPSATWKTPHRHGRSAHRSSVGPEGAALPAGPAPAPTSPSLILPSGGLRLEAESACPARSRFVERRCRPEQSPLRSDDPYVQSAIHDAVRAGLVIYSLYWRSRPKTPKTPCRPTEAKACSANSPRPPGIQLLVRNRQSSFHSSHFSRT